jgi:predicted metal-dependent peptidase
MSEDTKNTNNPDVKVEEFDLEYHLYSLLEKEAFFAAISRHVQKAKSKSIPTAGVRVTEDGNYEMLYNPDFFAKLPPIQRLGVLKHEFYHLVLEHVSERLPDTGMTKDWNIATDLSINGLIPDEVPESGCIPGKGPFADYPAGQTAEWYYNRIQQDKKNGKDPMGDSMDDHSGWGEGNDLPDEVKELAKQRVKEMMKEASKEANQTSNGWGNMPMNIRQDILDRINPKVNWRNVLRYFIKTSTRANKTRTLKRLNKRFPFIHSGVKVERRARIAISIDQSGSVSDELLVKFFSELDNLARLAEFTVVPFDTEVN